MSTQKTIFGKIIAAILNVFAENWETFVAKTWKKVPADLQDKVSIGVTVVELLKKAIDSQAADIITAIIPGHLDDDAKNWLRIFLPQLLDKYKVVAGTERVYTSQFYHTFATDVTQEATGLSYGQSALTTEVAYQNLKSTA